MMNANLTYTMSENYSFFLASLKVAENYVEPAVDFLPEVYCEDFRAAFLSSLKEERPYTVDVATLRVTYWGTVSFSDLENYPYAHIGEAILHISCDLSSPELGDWEAHQTITGDIDNWYIPF